MEAEHKTRAASIWLAEGCFKGWAIVELMGRQEIGYVTTEAYGQAVLFRIDTPDLPEREFTLRAPEWVGLNGGRQWAQVGSKVKRAASPPRSRLVAPGALYAINPCTEEAARTALEKSSPRPLILIEAPQRPLLEDADGPEDIAEADLVPDDGSDDEYDYDQTNS